MFSRSPVGRRTAPLCGGSSDPSSRRAGLSAATEPADLESALASRQSSRLCCGAPASCSCSLSSAFEPDRPAAVLAAPSLSDSSSRSMSRASCLLTAAFSASLSCAASPRCASFLQALPRSCRCRRVSAARPPRLLRLLSAPPELRFDPRSSSPPGLRFDPRSGPRGVHRSAAARFVPQQPLGPQRRATGPLEGLLEAA